LSNSCAIRNASRSLAGESHAAFCLSARPGPARRCLRAPDDERLRKRTEQRHQHEVNQHGVPGPVDLDTGGEDALVIRTGAEVEVRTGGAEFIEALASGEILAEAAKSALIADPCFDLPAKLATLIGAGVFVGYSLIEGRSDDKVDEARDIAF
jgi:hypothetical protein